jgi:hypothetical protein
MEGEGRPAEITAIIGELRSDAGGFGGAGECPAILWFAIEIICNESRFVGRQAQTGAGRHLAIRLVRC